MPKRSAEENGPVKKAQKTMGHWSLELLKLMKDPEYIVKADDLITIIKDGYNKAKFHYLILPNKRLHSIRDVKAEHLSLLKHMEKEAENLIKESPHKECNFKIGYHSVPSMSQLHLHVISDDFCSPYLKNKKHFNSFNTKFFLNSKGKSSYNKFNIKLTC